MERERAWWSWYGESNRLSMFFFYLGRQEGSIFLLLFRLAHFFFMLKSARETHLLKIKREFIFIYTRSFSLLSSLCDPRCETFFPVWKLHIYIVLCTLFSSLCLPACACYFGGKLVVLNNWSSMNVYVSSGHPTNLSTIIRGVQSNIWKHFMDG